MMLVGITNGHPPAPTTGHEGDYFLDLGTGHIYGPKAQSTWPTTPAKTLTLS